MRHEELQALLDDSDKFRLFVRAYSNGVLDALFGNMDAGEERHALELLENTIDGFLARLVSAFPGYQDFIRNTVDVELGAIMTERLQANLNNMFA